MKFTYIPLLCTTLFLTGCSIPQEKIDAYKANIKTQREKLRSLQQERLLQEYNLQLIEALLTLRTRELEYALQPSNETARYFELATDTLFQKLEQLQKEIQKQSAPISANSLSSFEKSIYDYQKAFNDLASSAEKLGYTKSSGARSELRIAAQMLMSEIEDIKELQDDFKVRYYALELRRAEKDLLLHQERHYYVKAKEKSADLLDVIQSEGYNTEYYKMEKILSQYTKAIESYIRFTEEKNTHKETLRQTYKLVGSALSDLRQQIQKDSVLLEDDQPTIR